jgi:ferric-dicitrate binding protein FerR (iron transport regulator)
MACRKKPAWRRAVRTLLALFAASCAAIFTLTQSVAPAAAQELAARPEPWLVLDVAGQVTVRHGAQPWQPLFDGELVAAESEIRTGRAAMVVLARGEDRVQLMSESSLELPPAEEGGAFTRFIHWFGRAIFEVEPRPAPNFEVDTPYLTAIVKGTAFSVDVAPGGAAVAVETGVVAVATADGTVVDVHPGQIARVHAGRFGLALEGPNRPETTGPDADHAWPTPDFNPVEGTLP